MSNSLQTILDLCFKLKYSSTITFPELSVEIQDRHKIRIGHWSLVQMPDSYVIFVNTGSTRDTPIRGEGSGKDVFWDTIARHLDVVTFSEYLEWASAEVATWPEWKRRLLK